MRPLDVTVSSGGKFHAYHIVRAAQQAGYLRYFITTIYDRYEMGIDRSITENVGAYIRDGLDGFIVPIRDPDALADRLLRLYCDENLRREMGRSA